MLSVLSIYAQMNNGSLRVRALSFDFPKKQVASKCLFAFSNKDTVISCIIFECSIWEKAQCSAIFSPEFFDLLKMRRVLIYISCMEFHR